jgi:hypothetical protein
MIYSYKGSKIVASSKKEAIKKIIASGGFVTVKGDITKANYEQYLGKKVNVIGSVFLNNLNLKEIPIIFGTIDGNFSCSGNKLVSLKNCPSKVTKCFYCYENRLVSLEGCPGYVGENFHCYKNNLTYLKHCPSYVGGTFYCFLNKKKFTKEEVMDLCKVKSSNILV